MGITAQGKRMTDTQHHQRNKQSRKKETTDGGSKACGFFFSWLFVSEDSRERKSKKDKNPTVSITPLAYSPTMHCEFYMVRPHIPLARTPLHRQLHTTQLFASTESLSVTFTLNLNPDLLITMNKSGTLTPSLPVNTSLRCYKLHRCQCLPLQFWDIWKTVYVKIALKLYLKNKIERSETASLFTSDSRTSALIKIPNGGFYETYQSCLSDIAAISLLNCEVLDIFLFMTARWL